MTSGVTAIIRDGEYADTAYSPVLALGLDRAGTYEVWVHADGYEEWYGSGYTAERKGACDYLDGVAITAYLTPTAPQSR